MEAIVLTDDELKRLEKLFGPIVRQMGQWNSDGIFGYSSVPIFVVERAAETLKDQDLDSALSRLRNMKERTKPFVELLEMFGPVLIERIVTAYRECSLELVTGTRLAPKPPKRESRTVSVATAAA
jgi:hypothetical protein